MKLIKIIVLLSISISLAFSQENNQRILITKTSKKSNFSKINKTLAKLGVKMYVQTLNGNYYIYSPIYSSSQDTTKILKKLKKDFPYSKIVYISDAKEKLSQESTLDEKNIYINFALGYSSTNGTTGNLAASEISNSGIMYALEGGYTFSDEWSASLAYQNSSTSDISTYNIYSEINYRYGLSNKFSVGGGLLLGFSSLEIDNYSSSTASTNLVYGFDLAGDYKFTNEIYIYSKYQGLFLDHAINIDDTSKISFSYENNFLVGIGYRF